MRAHTHTHTVIICWVRVRVFAGWSCYMFAHAPNSSNLLPAGIVIVPELNGTTHALAVEKSAKTAPDSHVYVVRGGEHSANIYEHNFA